MKKFLLRWRIPLIALVVVALLLMAAAPTYAQNGAMNNINYSATLPPNCSATGTFGYPRVWYLISDWNGYTAGFYWCNNAGQWVNGSAGLKVNGSSTVNSTSPFIGNFNSTTPSIPAGDAPVHFQFDTSNPSNISGWVSQSATSVPYVQLRNDIFSTDGSLATATVNSQLLGTCSVAALAQGNTAQCPYQFQLAGNFFAGPVPIGPSGAQVIQTKICRDLSSGTPCRFDGPVAAGDTIQANSSVHTGAWPSTDTLGNASTATSGANGFWWTSVNIGTGDTANCATAQTCDGISVTTTWTNFTIILQELRGPTAVDTSATSSYGGSGPDMSATTNVTTTGTNDFLVADAFWSSDTCGSVSTFAVTSSPSYTSAYLYPVTGSGGIYAGYIGILDGNAATAGAYATTETGTANCTSGGAGEQLSVIAYKTSGVATDAAAPGFRDLTCLDLYQIDPNLALTCNAASSTSYLTGVTLSAPSFFNVTGNGTGSLGIPYNTGLTGSENYFLCVNSSGVAGLFAPASCGLSNAFSAGVAGTSYQDVDETAAPADPASGVERVYADSTTHKLTCLTSSGTSCMPSSGVSSASASAPIQVNGGSGPATGSINISCPTCSTSGSTTTTAPSGEVMGSPVTSVGTSASATANAPCLGNPLTSCTAGTVTAGQHWIAFFETDNQASSDGGCTLTSSLGNNWVQQSTAASGLETAQVYFATITTSGTDVLTPTGADCSVSGVREVMVVAQVFNATGVDVITQDSDSPTYAVSITGNYAYEGYLVWASNAYNANQDSSIGEGTTLVYSDGAPSYRLNLYGAGNGAGTQTFHFSWTYSGAYGRGVIVGLVPALGIESSNVTHTSTNGSSVTSISTGANVATGQGIIAYVGPWTTTRASCNVTDTLGNSFTEYSPNSNSGSDAVLIATSVASGADTLTFNASCANSQSGRTQGAWVITTNLPVTLRTSANTSGNVLVQDANGLVMSWGDPAKTAVYNGTFSPAPYTLQVSTTVPNYILGAAAPPYGTRFYESYSGGYAEGVILALGPAVDLETGPVQPRPAATSDFTTPAQQVCGPVFTLTGSSQGYDRFDGSRCGIFEINLTGNMPGYTAFGGFQDGQRYTFIFTQDATGGRTWNCSVLSTSAGVNYCPALNLSANAVTVLHARYDASLGTNGTLLFPIPGTLYNTDNAAGTASIAATTMATVPATIYGNRYWASFQVTVTAAGVACTGPATVAVNLIWTDPNASSAQTVTLGTFSISSNGNLGTPGDTFNVSEPRFSAKASTNIQFSTTYTSCPGGTTQPTVQVSPELKEVR